MPYKLSGPDPGDITIEAERQSILQETNHARIKILTDYFDDASEEELGEYLKSVNTEGLNEAERLVVAELIPYAAGLLIPAEFEENEKFKEIFDELDAAVVAAGANLLIKKDGEPPCDEYIRDQVANFRAFFIALESFGLENMKVRAAEKIRGALARMFTDIGYPVPPGLMDLLSQEEYKMLDISSRLHRAGSKEREYQNLSETKNIADGNHSALPASVTMNSRADIQKILTIMALSNRQQFRDKNKKREMENLTLNGLYLDFLSGCPDPAMLLDFLLEHNGTYK